MERDWSEGCCQSMTWYNGEFIQIKDFVVKPSGLELALFNALIILQHSSIQSNVEHNGRDLKTLPRLSVCGLDGLLIFKTSCRRCPWPLPQQYFTSSMVRRVVYTIPRLPQSMLRISRNITHSDIRERTQNYAIAAYIRSSQLNDQMKYWVAESPCWSRAWCSPDAGELRFTGLQCPMLPWGWRMRICPKTANNEDEYLGLDAGNSWTSTPYIILTG